MPFVLLIAGLALLISGVNNTQGDLYNLIKGDFFGANRNFIFWFVAIFAIGALGNIKTIKPLSDIFLALVIVVLFLANKGFFAQFTQAIGTAKAQPATQNVTASGGIPPLPNLPDLMNIGF
ncbi:MAG: hypothetical protein ACREO5_06600 [Candidatus Binatia bacterium]